MIQIENVSAGYGKRGVLKGASASFRDGCLTGIIGPNGCGKTTLLRAVCGEISLTVGRIFVDGKDVREMGRRERARHAGRFLQDRNVPDMTVKMLAEAGRHPHMPFAGRMGEEDLRAVESAMERCGVSGMADRELKELSGGQRQRAYIAMLLSQEAQNLLLDEPAAYLDPAARFEMMELFRELAREGKCVCAVMHDTCLALEYCDSVAVMEGGRIVFQGAPEEAAAQAGRVFGIDIERTESGAWAVRKRRG